MTLTTKVGIWNNMWQRDYVLCNYKSVMSLRHLRPRYANANHAEIKASKEISIRALNYHQILLMCNIWIEISVYDKMLVATELSGFNLVAHEKWCMSITVRLFCDCFADTLPILTAVLSVSQLHSFSFDVLNVPYAYLPLSKHVPTKRITMLLLYSTLFLL